MVFEGDPGRSFQEGLCFIATRRPVQSNFLKLEVWEKSGVIFSAADSIVRGSMAVKLRNMAGNRDVEVVSSDAKIMKRNLPFYCLSGLIALTVCSSIGMGKEQARAWTDPAAARREDPDFLIQGEYGSANPGADYGVQVVALGDESFDAYVLQDGLPGLGWTKGKARTLLHGKREGDLINLTSADLATSAKIKNSSLELTIGGKTPSTLPRIERQSPTLGAKPPEGAVVLFDGSSADLWDNGKVENGLLATGCTTKQTFRDYQLHVEFRTPYVPAARGQQRGNSGVYHSGRWETQILDSFALAGEENETGGIYSISKPRLNMCLPPLAWQSYDVDFTAAKFAADDQRTAWPRITVRLNGVIVQENLELAKDFTTSAPVNGPLNSPEGPVNLQNHGNPVFFRNIWIVPGK